MAAQAILYILTSILTAAASFATAYSARLRWRRAGASALALLMFSVSVWCLFPALSLLVRTQASGYIFARLFYIFTTCVPMLWVRFGDQIVVGRKWMGPRLMTLLWIGPLISLTLVWTNHWHHLFWRELEFYWVEGFLNWKVVFGPGFWFHSLYSYSLILLGAYILIRYSISSFSVYRKQNLALLAAFLLPALASLPAVLGLSRLPLTPVGLALSGLILHRAILHSGLLNLRPIAREALIEQLRDGLIIINSSGQVVDINPRALELLGKGEKQVLGLSVDELLTELAGRELHLEASRNQKIEFNLLTKEQKRSIQLIVSALKGPDEQVIGSLVHLHEITALKKTEEALRASESHSRAILAALPDQVRIIDQDGCVQPVEGCTHPGTNLRELYPQPLAEEMLKAVHETLHLGACHSFTYSLEQEGANVQWFEARMVPLEDGSEEPSRVVWIDRDITRQKQLYEQVEQLANTDALTGLANRRYFFETAQAFLDRHASDQALCAFILIDIDHFKEVNDGFGHLAGDEVLNKVAARLAQQVRSSDMVARYGGEEFAVFLPYTSREEAEVIATRLCQAIKREPFPLGETLIPLSISVGLVSAWVSSDLQIDQMIERADGALYAAKQAGRNTVRVFPLK